MNKNIGVKYGIITAIVLILTVILRNTFLAEKQMWFFLVIFLTFVFMVVMMVKTGRSRRKELGGVAEIKELFQSIFIVILFAAVAHNLTKFVYLNYINPDFVRIYSESYIELLSGVAENAQPAQVSTIEELVEQIRENAKSPENYSIKTHIQGIATWIISYSIIGLIIAAIQRRKSDSVEF